LNEIILNLHAEGGAHASKGEHHQGDQRPISHPGEVGNLGFLAAFELYGARDGDAIE
jgi:hypothetical protein